MKISKSRLKILIAFSISYLSISYQLLAISCFAESFGETHWSSRSAGLGNAFTGLADDVDAIWLNPAGTGQLELSQGVFNYLVPHINRENVTSYSGKSFGFIFPNQKINAWGIAWNNYRLKDTYQENTVILNLAQKFSPPVPFTNRKINNLYLGVNLKGLFYSPYKPGEDIFDTLSGGRDNKSAFGADAGIYYKFNPSLNFGLSVLNLNRPPIHLVDLERLPIETRVGASYSLPNYKILNLFGINRVIPTLDFVRKGDKWQSSFGSEIVFFNDLFTLRGGVNSDEASTGISLGSMQAGNFSFNFDYSYIYGYNKDTRDRLHMISVKLSRHPQKKVPEKEVQEERISPYRFGPEDVIQIITRNHDEFSGKFTVDPYGKILIPLIGEIKIEGFTKEELTERLKTEISKYVQDANVLVSIVTYRSKVVLVLGEVNAPGKYPIEGDTVSLRDIIAAAGFPTGLAATWRVYIIKPAVIRPTYKIVNFYKILYRGRLQHNIMLSPGDVVYVPATILGKISASLSHILDPFFKTRGIVTPLSQPRPLIEETTTTE